MHSSTIALSVLIIWLTLILKRKSVKRPSYPPGPPPKFLVGNLFDFPAREAYRVYDNWAKAYGDVMHLEAFGMHVIILNSQKASLDLLDKRSGIYSNRTVTALIHETAWPSWNLAFSPYGKRFREKRRLAQQHLRPDRMTFYESIQEKKALELIDSLSKTPEDFLDHARTASTGIMMSIIYDYDVATSGDPFVELADSAVHDFSEAIMYPGSDIINSLPFVTYLPSWLPFKKRLEKTRESSYTMRSTPFKRTRQAMADGNDVRSLVTDMLSKTGGDEEKATVVQDLVGALFAAGADTTPSALGTFFLAMASNPRVQKAGQAEVDRITGGNRLPEFSDRSNMPYVNSIVREVLRRGLILPLSLAHVSTEDDIYNGFFIPKGSIVMSNTWAISNDEKTFENPTEFRPERYMTEDGKLLTAITVSDSHVFGHGRRACPGKYLADTSLFLAMSYVLATFDINPPKGVDNIELTEDQYTERLVFQPSPFECRIEKRSKSVPQSL